MQQAPRETAGIAAAKYLSVMVRFAIAMAAMDRSGEMLGRR
jgi:hypothetical protein